MQESFQGKTTRRAPKAISALALFLALVLGLSTPASAAEITDAITDVNVTTTSTSMFGTVDFETDWCVPNGSVGGDFFTLTLPPQLSLPPAFTFDLFDAAGNVVAVATVSGGVITFTLTDAINGQNNVCGTAFITANVNQNAVTGGTTEDLPFVTASETFDESVDITVFTPNDGATKFLRITDSPTALGNDVVTGIDTPLLTAADVGQTITVVDTPGPGLAIDCAAARGTFRNFPANTSAGAVPSSAFGLTCSPTMATFTYVVTPADVGLKIRFVLELMITDPTQTMFTNSGTVDVGGEVSSVSANDEFLAAGGTGAGDVFDLALFKTLADGSNLATVAPGDTVTFTLTVENQGTVGATNIDVVDYLPAGLTLADPNWIDNADGSASLATPIPALAAGASTTVDIMFTVDAGASGTIDNFAEISGAMDDMGNVVPDADSTPDAIDDDVFLTDDDVTGNGLAGGDEDDHDRAQLNVVPPPIFDLALFKTLADGTNLGTVSPGDTVTFTLTIENQGAVDAADVEVVDYLPAGLTLADPSWIDNADGTASLATPIPTLLAGTSTTVDIIFTVDAGATGTIDNFAEISGATDGDGNPVTDVDSTPDAVDDDVFLTDDDVTGDGLAGGDEDDHDRAQLNVVPAPVFDLALFKTLADGSNLATVAPGDTVTFTLTIENQGDVDAADVAVTDYLPAGLTLADPNWIDNGDGTANLATPIAALSLIHI